MTTAHVKWFSLLAVILAPASSIAASSPSAEEVALEKAERAAQSGKSGEALGFLELALAHSAERDARVFGRAQGQYWRIIHQENDFPRAYDFFNLLAEKHSSSPDVLA